MNSQPLLKLLRYLFYAILVCGLIYILIPIEPLVLSKLSVETVVQRLSILIIVALFLERALEVYALSYFSQEKSRLATQLEQRQLELNSLSPDVKAAASNAGVKAAQLKLLNAKESFRSYKQHIRQSILRVAIVFGLLMGLVGIRSLEGIIQYPAPAITLEIFRLYLFRVLDLGLTAGLIAGGSEGIHSLIKKLYSFFPDASQTVASSLQAVGKNVS